MDGWREPIAGVSLEAWAELCAATAGIDDGAAQAAIASAKGVEEAAWVAAKAGWTERMSDPAHQGRVAHAFVPLYAAAQAARREGGPPATLERYAKVVAEYAFGRDADGRQVALDVLLARFQYDRTTWSEITGYWTPRVNDPADEACARFRDRMQQESDRIFGVDRAQRAEVEATQDSAPEIVEPVVTLNVKPEEGVVGIVMGWMKSVLG